MPSQDASEVAQKIIDLIKSNLSPLGLKRVDYGDRDNVKSYPSVCVQPGVTSSDYQGAQFRALNTFEIFVTLYYAVATGLSDRRKEADQKAEQIRDVLHTDKQMGNTVHSGFVVRMEYGYAQRGGNMLEIVRITWQGQSKTVI